MAPTITVAPDGLEPEEMGGDVPKGLEVDTYPSDDDEPPDNPDPYTFAGDDDEEEGVEDAIEVEVEVGRDMTASQSENDGDATPSMGNGCAMELSTMSYI